MKAKGYLRTTHRKKKKYTRVFVSLLLSWTALGYIQNIQPRRPLAYPAGLAAKQ